VENNRGRRSPRRRGLQRHFFRVPTWRRASIIGDGRDARGREGEVPATRSEQEKGRCPRLALRKKRGGGKGRAMMGGALFEGGAVGRQGAGGRRRHMTMSWGGVPDPTDSSERSAMARPWHSRAGGLLRRTTGVK
jgi:hypothetical protein